MSQETTEISESSKCALDFLSKVARLNDSCLRESIDTAFRLGYFEGALKMAKIGLPKTAEKTVNHE